MGLASRNTFPSDAYKVFDEKIHQLRFYPATVRTSELEIAIYEFNQLESFQWFHDHVKEIGHVESYDVVSDSSVYRVYGYMLDQDWTFYKMKF